MCDNGTPATIHTHSSDHNTTARKATVEASQAMYKKKAECTLIGEKRCVVERGEREHWVGRVDALMQLPTKQRT